MNGGAGRAFRTFGADRTRRTLRTSQFILDFFLIKELLQRSKESGIRNRPFPRSSLDRGGSHRNWSRFAFHLRIAIGIPGSAASSGSSGSARIQDIAESGKGSGRVGGLDHPDMSRKSRENKHKKQD